MARPNGQIRRGQIINVFGPGALMDLPHHAAIVGGLDTWNWGGDDRKRKIIEPRLLSKIELVLERPGLTMYEPPADSQDPDAAPSGLAVYRFPEWFTAQITMKGPQGQRTRPLVHRRNLITQTKWQGPDRKKYDIVPIRFVQACPNGHISDVDWYAFVHGVGVEGSEPCRRDLFVDEWGTSGDLTEVVIRCDCGKSKQLIIALEDKTALGWCRGRRPWLGGSNSEPNCRDPKGQPTFNRLLNRSASNAWFPQVLSVISIPDEDEKLRGAIEKIWKDHLQYVESIDDLPGERKRSKVAAALEGYSNEAVWAEIERRRGGSSSAPSKTIKQAEIETLLASPDEIGQDKIEGDFYARRWRPTPPLDAIWNKIDRVVLIHRLREVVSLVGFTRFEPATNDIDGELAIGVNRAALADEVRWVPAVENRGEGVFISFKSDEIRAWRKRSEVSTRELDLAEGFKLWKKQYPSSKAQFVGAPYMMLHSLAHLLITQVSLECGYSSSAIRERVYAGDAGYGILLYTGTPDSEGTLGGLVEIGRKIDQHLRNAIELGRLCSNDPVCAQHSAKQMLEERFLLGAACHGCLLISETSCERFNQYLDRSLVVATVGATGAEFFTDQDLALP
jgi:hypothetical protein